MKVRTSVTLSAEVLEAVDRHARANEYRSRSELIETVLRSHLRRCAAEARERRDAELLDARADDLNDEAADALEYQIRV